MTIKNITVAGFLVAILIIVKYAFGFVAGFELVTFFVVMYGLFLKWQTALIITICFVLATGALYGMGTWWVMYWFIYPTITLLTALNKRWVMTNNIFVAFWTAFFAFSILPWYAIHDFILFGKSYALLQMGTAVIPNTIGAVSNFVAAMVLYYPMVKFFERIEVSERTTTW